MALAVRRTGLVLTVTGDLDVTSAPGLTVLLRVVTRSPRPVLVDLAGARFADTAGLLPLLREVDRRWGTAEHLTLGTVSRPVARVLDLLGVPYARRVDRPGPWCAGAAAG